MAPRSQLVGSGSTGVLESMELKQLGWIYGLFELCIYEGLDADVDSLMGRTDSGDMILGGWSVRTKGRNTL